MTNKVVSSASHTGGGTVKRDMDLIRRILLSIEGRDNLDHQELTMEGVDDVTLGRHVEMLHAAGYVDGVASQEIARSYARVLVRDLTWDGHEFLGTIRNETVYGKLKEAFTPAELASVSLKVVADTAVELSKAWMRERLGLA